MVKKMKAAILHLVRAAALFAISAKLWILILFLLGVGLIISGIHFLFGTGWTLLAAGFMCFGMVFIIGKGLGRG